MLSYILVFLFFLYVCVLNLRTMMLWGLIGIFNSLFKAMRMRFFEIAWVLWINELKRWVFWRHIFWKVSTCLWMYSTITGETPWKSVLFHHSRGGWPMRAMCSTYGRRGYPLRVFCTIIIKEAAHWGDCLTFGWGGPLLGCCVCISVKRI